MDEGQSELLFVLTKSDQPAVWDITTLLRHLRARSVPYADMGTLNKRVLSVSARLGSGLPALLTRILDLALEGRAAQMLEQVLLTQSRHERAMRRAHESLTRVADGLDAGASSDLLAVDLRAALDALGEIVGATTRAEVVDEIFRRFCIGK
jgi:tRNA modification GTPase